MRMPRRSNRPADERVLKVTGACCVHRRVARGTRRAPRSKRQREQRENTQRALGRDPRPFSA